MTDTVRGKQTFAYRFALLIAATGRPQRQLAKALGYKSHTTIGRIDDRTHAPDGEKLDRYAQVLKTTPQWLSHGDGEPPDYAVAFLAKYPDWKPGTKPASKRSHPKLITLLKQLNEHEFSGFVPSKAERQAALDAIAKLAKLAAQPTDEGNGD
jgi:transcriptional regulator with XRE-family HTH domain